MGAIRSSQIPCSSIKNRHTRKPTVSVTRSSERYQTLTPPSLLFQIACWIGEGPHLDMLTILLELGLDPGKLDPALFNQWPPFTNPNWQAEAITPDPFGIDFLRQCLQKEPGEASYAAYLMGIMLTSMQSLPVAIY